MKAYALLFALLSLPTSASAQEPDWGRAQRIEIRLSNFKYQPESIALDHGRPYLLHFVNTAEGGHDFVAKRFFAAAAIAPADRSRIRDGEIELAGGAASEVRLVAPKAGEYDVHCSHFMHSLFGMKGKIVVR